MDSSLASNSPRDCPTTREESELMWTFLAPAALARSRPASTASYSATLCEALNSNLRACSVTNPSGDSRTIPAPPPLSIGGSINMENPRAHLSFTLKRIRFGLWNGASHDKIIHDVISHVALWA